MSLLPPAEVPDDGVGLVLAGFLANVPAAWAAATPDERNQLARQLFGQVVIANRTAVAVVPRPDLRPFFEAVTPENRIAASAVTEAASGQGAVPSTLIRNWRKRRGSLSCSHHSTGVRLGRAASDEAHGWRLRSGSVFACPAA
jgi:hypothetical protein